MSEEGVFTLHRNKMRVDVAMVLHLLGTQEWDPNSVAGVNGRLVFAAAFRHPILSIMDDVFAFCQRRRKGAPSQRARDEMICMLGILPLAFTNVRAKIYPKMSATDASPTGGLMHGCAAEKA